MHWAYQTLLDLYPADYTGSFAAGMLGTFEKSVEDARRYGRVAYMRLALAELVGLLRGAAAEWIAKLTTDRCVRGRCLPDLRMMRPVGVSRESWFRGA
jgi:hypothetical protein